MTNRLIVQILSVLVAFSLLSACKQVDDPAASSSSPDVTIEDPDNGAEPNDPVFEPIQISAAPSNQFAYPGQTVAFAVHASSNIALSYQWYLNGDAIEGANDPELSFVVGGAVDAGTYSVEVSNASTSETTAAELTVGGMPEITSQPSSVAVYPGDAASMSVSAGGTDLQYQWQQYSNGAWIDIEGATKKALLILNADASKATQYHVTISNDGGSVTSSSATLSLKDPVIITQQPSAVQIAAGLNATFTAAASGYGTLKYRWYKSGYAVYDSSKYSGATTPTLIIKNVTSSDASLYKLKAYNADNKYAFTNPAQLSVAGPAHVTVQPVDTTLYSGKSGSLVIAASGDQPMTYQWQKWNGSSWQNVGGATASTLAFSSVTSAAAGRYRCQVSNAVAQDTSAEATVTVLSAAAITASPKSLTVNSGASASFTVTATGDSLQYEWTKNGEVLSNTTKTLSFAAAKEVDEATYGCRVYNGGSSVNCAAFTLTVNSPLAITQQPQDQNSYEGGSATFTVGVSGDPTPSVQWYFAGKVVGTGTSLSLSNLAVGQAGQYTCVVSNGTDTLNCNSVTLAISQSVKILSQPSATTTTEGCAITLTMNASGEALNYDWSKNGASLGVNSPTLSFASISVNDEGTYSCRIWNTSSSANCNSFTVTVNQGVKITSQPTAASAFEGGSVTLKVSATGKPTPTVDWYKDGTLIKTNSASLTLSSLKLADSGSYQCVVINKVNSAKCNAVQVTVREVVRITKQLANQTLNEGDSIVLNLTATGEGPISYQCYHDGVAVVAGTDPSSLVIPNAQASDAGSYYCVVSNAGSSVKSSTVSVSVISSVVTQSALLSWTAPTTRANGVALKSSEIAGYEVYMATSATGSFTSVITVTGTATQALVTDLAPGTYYFCITTLDVNGLESGMSEMFSVTIR